jgi:hypothetical protein
MSQKCPITPDVVALAAQFANEKRRPGESREAAQARFYNRLLKEDPPPAPPPAPPPRALTDREQLVAKAIADPAYAQELVRQGILPIKRITRTAGAVHTLGEIAPDFEAFLAQERR